MDFWGPVLYLDCEAALSCQKCKTAGYMHGHSNYFLKVNVIGSEFQIKKLGVINFKSPT